MSSEAAEADSSAWRKAALLRVRVQLFLSQVVVWVYGTLRHGADGSDGRGAVLAERGKSGSCSGTPRMRQFAVRAQP